MTLDVDHLQSSTCSAPDRPDETRPASTNSAVDLAAETEPTVAKTTSHNSPTLSDDDNDDNDDDEKLVIDSDLDEEATH